MYAWLLGEKDPRAIWDMLGYANKSKCKAAVHTLRNRLINIKMDQGMSVRSYVNKICTLERQLAFAGKVVDEDDKKYAVLKKAILQESYNGSFTKMVSSLEQTEDELMTSSTSGSAFITDGRTTRTKQCCWICEKSEHKMLHCFNNPKSRN